MTDPGAVVGGVAVNPRIDQWVRFTPDGQVELHVGKVELGQGVRTALAQIAADELCVDFDRIRVARATTGGAPDEGFTAGSASIQQSGEAVRQVCATARWALLTEATKQFCVERERVALRDGSVAGPDGRRLGYADLLPDVLARPIASPVDDERRPPARFVGRNVPRSDLPAKIAGEPCFIHDIVLPGMVHARMVRPPRRGARPVLPCREALADRLGLEAIVVDGSVVAAIAAREEIAIAGALELARDEYWKDGAAPSLQDHEREASTERTIVEERGAPVVGGGTRLRSVFRRPLTAHASIGPSCALASWSDGHLNLWTSSQGIYPLRNELALAFGVTADAVHVEHVDGAGCYGHNGADDAAYEAALLSRSLGGRPVRLQWSRAEELAASPFGPPATIELEAAFDESGLIVDWRHEVWSTGHVSRPGTNPGVPAFASASLLARPFDRVVAVDPPQETGGGASRNAVPIYSIPNMRVVTHRIIDAAVRTSSQRSLGAFANVFGLESFMDELAEASGADPVEFRLRHLTDPRGRSVLARAASMSGWPRSCGEDEGQGVGFARYKNTSGYCAVVAEVTADTVLVVNRLFIAVDVGLVVNPDGVRNQVEGGAIQATSWTLKESVRHDGDNVLSTDWESYPILTFSEAPAVDVEIIDALQQPSLGAGEISQGPVAAAIANALMAATGIRVRELPLTRDRIMSAATA